MQSRRRTLAAAVGVLAGGSVVGDTLDGRPTTVGSGPPKNPSAHREIDVAVFTAERLWRPPPGSDAGPRYRARLAKTALERALPTLSDDAVTIEAEVAVAAEPVPDAAIEGDDAEAILAAFEAYLDERAPSDAVAADSNLLLAQAPDAGSTGLARVPDGDASRATGGTAAAVFDGLGLGQNDVDAATGYRTGAYGRALSATVHEVGHTLGLGHGDGASWRDADDPSRVFVTPMRTGYVDADARPVYTPQFNPEIDPRSLVLG